MEHAWKHQLLLRIWSLELHRRETSLCVVYRRMLGGRVGGWVKRDWMANNVCVILGN